MICEVPTPLRLVGLVASSLIPADCVDSWDWICEHGRMPDGVPFDGDMVPWCRGVCEAWDNPDTREIALQWGTRLGKTSISLQLMAKSAATKPMPGLFATSTQSLSERTVRNKIYPVLDSVEATAGLLPAPRWRTMKEIRLRTSPWYVAWSGSDTQLADLSAFYGIANEVDKWSFNERQEGAAGEGDPLSQFFERFKEFYNAKILMECSPTTRRKSRIEAKRLASNNCRYEVPCPKCGAYQPLRLGEEGKAGGIRFDRLADDTSTPEHARATARYVCEACAYEIYDDQRPRMMRSGVWVPEGCHADKRGRVKGTPRRGPRIWGSQLSSLYSLQLRWGDIAEEFVRVKGEPAKLRMFVNGWLAKTWEPYRSKSEPEQVGQRLTTDVPRGVIPEWATWLFAGIDRQLDHYVYWVAATNHEEREALVDHGTYDTLDEIEELVIRRKYEHADGGEPLWPAATAIDCGYRTKEIYTFCQKFKGTPHRVYPIKGANTDCAGEPYERKIIGINEGTTARTKKILVRAGQGLTRIRVSPFYYEPITQLQLDDLNPGEPKSLELHAECREDVALLRDLCNGAESEEPSKSDPNRHLWVKRWDNEPNDLRDAKKYCRCIMDVHFKRRWRIAEKRQAIVAAKAPRVETNAPTREEIRASRRSGVRERFRPRSGRRGNE